MMSASDIPLLSSIYPAVRLVAESLTDQELNALYLSARLGTDPTHTNWYEKAKSLLTQNDGKQMHEIALMALQVVWKERFGGKEKERIPPSEFS